MVPFFADLREAKSLESDKDLVEYFVEVLKIREDRKNSETEDKASAAQAHSSWLSRRQAEGEG